jgi:hypothetical protein
MSKTAISVTLDADNLTWLRGRANATGLRSVSELLDQIVSAARASGTVAPSRSVVGTVDIDEHDPALDTADDALRALFDASLRRPLVAKERPTAYRITNSRKRRG